MENEVKNNEETGSVEPIVKELNKELSITKFTSHLSDQITREISAAEIIIFAAAFATLPLVDLVAKSFGALGAATQALYAVIPAVAFGLGYWFSKDKIRPISIFLHSLAAIALIMASVALIPVIPGVDAYITGPGSIALGMPILAIIFIFAAAKVPNTGASYIFATVATIIIFFLSVAQLLAIPCNNAIIGDAANAQAICTATPYIQNLMIPIAVFALGYLSFNKKK